MQDTQLQAVIDEIQRILLKAQEASTILRDGKTVVAYEKFGGVIKNISALGAKLQQLQKVDTVSV